jgi:hypothetical protein
MTLYSSTLVAVISMLALVLTPLCAPAFNLPPMNLGFTNFADAGAPPGPQPGVTLFSYINWFNATTFRDADGDRLPGRNRASVLVNLNQLSALAPFREPLTGGLLGWDVLIPLVVGNLNTTIGPPGGLRANRGGFGDIIFGPQIQWNAHTLFGMPYLHRFEVNVSAPTGEFDKRFAFNPGSNLWSLEPYYAQTLWLLPWDVEISLRHHWLYSTENAETQIKPGHAYHLNYAVSYGLTRSLRVGVNGYYLQQLTNDKLRGRTIEQSQERAFALGPGIVYITPAIIFMVNSFAEFGVENRPQGFRLQGRFVYNFSR